MKTNFECKRCGKCCFRFPQLEAYAEDIKRWRKEGRDDILQYVDIFHFSSFDTGDLWFNPKNGMELNRCPFLRKVKNKDEYKCGIHETKPTVCKNYPFNPGQNGVCIRMK